MRKILPSMREKRRYVVFETIPKTESNEAIAAIKHQAKEFLGVYGLANANIQFLPDWHNGRGIVRVAHNYLDHLRSIFALVQPLIVKSIYTSGILNKARKHVKGGR